MTLPSRSTLISSATAWEIATAPSYAWSVSTGPMTTQQWLPSNDSRLVYTGSAAHSRVAGNTADFVRPAFFADKAGAGTGSDPLFAPPYGIRVRTSSAKVWLRLYQRSHAGFTNISSRASIRLKVDGKWTSVNPVYIGATVGYPSNPDGIATGEYYLEVTFASAALRTIELQTHLEFGGLAVETAASVVQAPAVQRTVAFLGDSLSGGEKHGTGNFALTGGSVGTYTSVTSFVWSAAQEVGYDSVINAGVGSTGFGVAGETLSFSSSARLQDDIIAHSPSLLIVGTANNDLGASRTPAQVKTNATTVISTVRAALPGTTILLLGNPILPAMGAGGAATVAPYNTALLEAADTDTDTWLLNPATGDLYNPAGAVVTSQGNWMTGRESFMSSDQQHPTQAGAHEFGVLLGGALRLMHPETTTEGPIETFLPGAYAKDDSGAVRRLRAWAKGSSGTFLIGDPRTVGPGDTPPVVLTTPLMAQPVVTPTTASLNWSAVEGAQGYRVYNNGVLVSEIATTSLTVTGLTQGTTYAFTVQAYAGVVTSSVSTPQVVQTTVTAGETAPAPLASYGPNGTHWPEDTPWKDSIVPNIIEVNCTWPAIKAAIQSVTDTMAAAGTIIKVRPGTLGGSGAGAGSTPALDNAGSRTRTRNILVTPRDGYGSVTITSSIRINRVYGVTFALLDARDVGITRTGCTNTHLAWSLVDATRTVGLKGEITENCNSYEVVNRNLRVKDLDPHGSGSGYDDTDKTSGSAWLRNCYIVGCYGAPAYLPDPTHPDWAGQDVGFGHNDTWQLYGSNMYYGFFFKDCAFWASPNCAIQIGKFGTSHSAADQAAAHARVDAVNGTTGVGAPTYLDVDHCLLVDAVKGAQVRYPIPANAKPLTVPQAINDRGGYDRMELKNSIIYGTVYSSGGNTRYRSVQNVTTNKTQISSLIAPSGGSFTVNPAMANWTAAQWDALSPIPTDTYLTSVWTA